MLLDDETNGLVRMMVAQIGAYRQRNVTRSLYIDGEHRLEQIGFSIPPRMRSLPVVVGWPKKACDVLSQRLVPAGLDLASGTLASELDAAVPSFELDVVERFAIDAALQHGPSFVFTAPSPKGSPFPVRHSVVTAEFGTVLLDPRSREPYAALELLDYTHVYLYLPGVILDLVSTTGGWEIQEQRPTGVPWVTVAPYVHGASIRRPLGVSRVTRPLMYFTDAAARTLLRSETSAEFYSSPGEYLLGANPEDFQDEQGNPVPGWEMLIGAVRVMPDEEDEITGERHRAQVEHRPQMTMEPHNAQLRQLAAQVSGETGIPTHYLGVVQDSNPTSAQAIEASEVDLIRIAETAQTSFNTGRVRLAMNTLAALNDPAQGGAGVSDAAVREVMAAVPQWQDPRTRSLIEQSQFVAQQVSAGNFQPGSKATLEQLRMSREDVDQHTADNKAAAGRVTAAELVGATGTDDAVEEANVLKAKLDAFGVGRRAGITFESLAEMLGLAGQVDDSGAVPTTLRLPERDAQVLEDA